MNQIRRQRHNSSEWPKLIEQWTKSEESAERFAARVGVKPVTLAKWSKAVASEQRQSAPVVHRKKSKAGTGTMFARVQVVEPATRATGLVEIVMRDGIMLRIHGNVDVDTLGAVLGALSRC
jgi:hypothetical protein